MREVKERHGSARRITGSQHGGVMIMLFLGDALWGSAFEGISCGLGGVIGSGG